MSEPIDLGRAGPFRRRLTLTRLSRAAPHAFAETPTPQELEAIAGELDLLGVGRMRFEGALIPVGGEGWRLEARLGARVTQACVVTLGPVRTRIDLEVRRSYMPGAAAAGAELVIDAEEAEDVEDLPEVLDLGAVAVEELALALPLSPRADGVGAGDRQAVPPGAAPIDETREKPFAGLAALRDKLTDEGG